MISPLLELTRSCLSLLQAKMGNHTLLQLDGEMMVHPDKVDRTEKTVHYSRFPASLYPCRLQVPLTLGLCLIIDRQK